MEKCQHHNPDQTKEIKIDDNLDSSGKNIIKIAQKSELGTGGRIWESVRRSR